MMKQTVCHGAWLDGHTGLPLAFMKGSGGVHKDALDSKAVMEGRKASASWAAGREVPERCPESINSVDPPPDRP